MKESQKTEIMILYIRSRLTFKSQIKFAARFVEHNTPKTKQQLEISSSITKQPSRPNPGE